MKQSTGARLDAFAELLLRWTTKINLIAPADRAHIQRRHIDDSLQLVPFLPTNVEVGIDLGSGGGFPGLVLAIATDIPFDLVESDHRKAAFLREAARITAAPVRVHCVRAEACALPPAGVVTVRALAPLPRLLPLVDPLLATEGSLLLLKGEAVDAELTAAALEWQMRVRRSPSITHAGATILQITGLRRVDHSGS